MMSVTKRCCRTVHVCVSFAVMVSQTWGLRTGQKLKLECCEVFLRGFAIEPSETSGQGSSDLMASSHVKHVGSTLVCKPGAGRVRPTRE